MTNPGPRKGQEQQQHERRDAIPAPTLSFRRRAWVQFQRAIDPLAPPKPLKLGRR